MTASTAIADDRISILLVDDRPGNLQALREILHDPRYDLVLASSGADALEAVLRREFALIVMDVAMPEMDGFETVERIKQRQRSAHIPVIFVTASNQELRDLHRGYAVGAVDFMFKPLEPVVVRAKVAAFAQLHLQSLALQESQRREAALLQRQAEAALHESHAQYDATFQQAPVGIAHLAMDGRFLRVNPRVCAILGRERAELQRSSIQDLIHPLDRQAHQDAVAALQADGTETARLELRVRHPGCADLRCEATISRLIGPDGQATRYVLVLTDVSEQRRAEEVQAFLSQVSEVLLGGLDSDATLQRVADAAVGVLGEACRIDACLDDTGRIEQVSAPSSGEALRWLEMLAPAELLNGAHPERPVVIPSLQTAGRQGSVICIPLGMRGRTCGTITLVRLHNVHAASDVLVAEELGRRVSLAVDNARLYRKAQRAIAARDEFFSIAAHELRTPITPLQLQLQSLLRQGDGVASRLEDPARVRVALERSERHVRRLTTLVENLLDVSRIESGQMHLQPEPLHLEEVVRDVTARFSQEAASAGCQVSVSTDGQLHGQWDRMRLEQVFTNLLTNAIKYGAGTPVAVRLSEADGMAVLEVQDGGIGIPQERLARVFDRFERAVDGPRYSGLGLGLYICRQIVQAHGGVIRVESIAGQGSTFTVLLPILPVEADDTIAQADSQLGLAQPPMEARLHLPNGHTGADR